MRNEGQVLVNLGGLHVKARCRHTGWTGNSICAGLAGVFSAGMFGTRVTVCQGTGAAGWLHRMSTCSISTAWHRNRARPEKRPSSIRYYTGGGMLRDVDGNIQKRCNRSASLATHKVPDDVIRVGREKAPGLARHHPAIFPVNLATEVITRDTDPGHIVYEPFSGSGTTIISAHKTGRRCRAVELQPEGPRSRDSSHSASDRSHLAINAADETGGLRCLTGLNLSLARQLNLGTGANDNEMTTDAVV